MYLFKKKVKKVDPFSLFIMSELEPIIWKELYFVSVFSNVFSS